MSADTRLTAAREFLAAARKHKVAELPPSLLMRECAELRRLLSQVLCVIGEEPAAGGRQVTGNVVEFPVPATDAAGTMEYDSALALDALAVAAEYRRYRASENRRAFTPGEPVPDFDLRRADEYDDLADRIREVTR